MTFAEEWVFSNIEALEEITKGRLKNSTAEQLEMSVQTAFKQIQGKQTSQTKGIAAVWIVQ